MEKLPRQKYTKEFREQAVKLVSEQALTVPEAAKRLSMSGQTLSNWVFKARQGKLAGMDGNRKRAGPTNLNNPLSGFPVYSGHDTPRQNGEPHEQTYTP